MKKHPRRYERVYTDKDNIKRMLNRDLIDFQNGNTLEQYKEFTKNFLWDMEMRMYDDLVKFIWNRAQFIYNNVCSWYNPLEKGHIYNLALSNLYRNEIGFNAGILTQNGAGWVKKLATYFPDFYPDFFENNPFEVPYNYPYKYMNLECLYAVHKLEDRLELLTIGEEEKMSYPEFLDYVINHIKCENEELGWEKYSFYTKSKTLPYVAIRKI